jgi:hypothetical protein
VHLLDQKLVAALFKEEERDISKMGCRKLEVTIMKVFNYFELEV